MFIDILEIYPHGVYGAGMKTIPNVTTHKENLHRIARIAGQVQGVQRMVEQEEYCIDIITQIQAVRSALRSLELQILNKHMRHCVQNAFATGATDAAAEKMDELLRILKRQS